ncbi:MAG: hypothetical protein HG454_000680 [Clostridiales bacterium]|nr:hypothetical protein [Clostridiales bacterium]
MLLDIIIMHKKRKGIILKDLRGLEEILSGNDSIKYKRIESNNKNILRMRIETVSDNNNKAEAEILEKIKKDIRKSEHRVNYYITICYDGSAEYYCSKLMIPLAIFERNLRQFLYLISISLYDIEWLDRFISKEVIDDIKKKNNNNINKLVEKGLEYFTFQNYIKCLFTPRNLKSIEEMIKEVNDENEKEGVTKEDIVKIINNNTEKTMWEVIFNDIKIEFSGEDINNIRKIRNEVVHNKEMTSQKYEKYKKIINESNKKIKMVITKIEEEKYREKIFDIRPILDMYLNKFKEISDIISNSFKTNIELEKMIQSVTVMSNIIEQNNKRFENQIKPILTQANLINLINQSLYLKNSNTIYKEENKEENNKESESKIDND